jgi:protein SCO1
LRQVAMATIITFVLVACGGSSDGGSGDTLSGAVIDPAPQVDLVSLPSLSNPGTDIDFRARPSGVQVVYFGFTNCPDVCPTTLADLTIALRKLDPSDADLVDVVMVTVDPERDLEVLDTYVTSFIEDAVAAGTLDIEQTAAAGMPFGASWEVRTLDDGTVEVDHSPFLYAVDDAGRLVLTWQFGATSDDMSNDLSLLLNRNEV